MLVKQIPLCLLCTLLVCGRAPGAPIPPLGPSDIAGTVIDVRWVPQKDVKAMPGMSGSLGHDRVVPSHFLVTLGRYDGVSTDTAHQMTGYLDGRSDKRDDSTILLKLNHDHRDYLKKGMNIEVRGYRVTGDEGGTWTTYKAIRIVEGAPRSKP